MRYKNKFEWSYYVDVMIKPSSCNIRQEKI